MTDQTIFLANKIPATSRWAASVRRTFADHIPLYVCAVLFCGTTFVISSIRHVPLSLDAGLVLAFSIALGLFAIFVVLGLTIGGIARIIDAVRDGEAHPFRAALRWADEQIAHGDRPGNAFHALATFLPLLISFDALKEVITRINPFSWDALFAKWDLILGMGQTPWERLQPLFGFPLVTVGINLLYGLWFPLILGSLLWEGFSPKRDVVRLQYLLAFAFVWFIGGNVLAILFSSAGPCFYGRLNLGANPYAAQMAYLHTVSRQWPLWSLTVQDTLWNSYLGRQGAISGISAMPSIHVTASTLLVLLGMRRSRLLGAALSVFAALIFIGSIRLAWHYAADGIAGIILAYVFWSAAGVLARATYRIIDERRAPVPNGDHLPATAG